MTWTLVVLHFWKNHWIEVFSWQISPTKRIGGIEWHPHLTILTIRLPWQLKNQDWIANISSTRTSFHYVFMTSWWFQSIWKNISQLGSFPQVGIKIKHNLSCHHLIRWIWIHFFDFIALWDQQIAQYVNDAISPSHFQSMGRTLP